MPVEWNIAIETSSPRGSVAIGRGNDLLETVAATQPRRHNLDLMPAIDTVFRRHRVSPAAVGEIYVSLGPGSFTGLRIAVATARMLALTTGARLVGVPTAEVIAENVDPPSEAAAHHLAVCLNLKRDQYHTTRFCHDGEHWAPDAAPALMTLADLFDHGPRPLMVLATPPPETDGQAGENGVTWCEANRGVPRAEALWQLGHARGEAGHWTEPHALLPIYARPPEAVEMWERRKKNKK